MRSLVGCSEFGKGQDFTVVSQRVLLQLADGHRSEGAGQALVCVLLTCVCLMQVALQAAHVGRFKGAELTPEGLVVPVVRLHMSVQIVSEGRDKLAVLAAVFVFFAEQCHG